MVLDIMCFVLLNYCLSTCGKHGQSKLVKETTNLFICIKYAEL